MTQQHKSFMGQFEAARQDVNWLKSSRLAESTKVATLTFPSTRSNEQVPPPRTATPQSRKRP